MAPRVESIQNQYKLNNDNTRVVTSAHNIKIPIGGGVAEKEGYGDKANYNNLTPSETQRLNKIYKLIEKICNEQGIDINLAKNQKLLERIASVRTSKELVALSDSQIQEIVKILDDSLGWGDGLGYGKKDINDLNKLVNDISDKKALKKVGGNKWKKFWHNATQGVKGFFGGETIDKCKTKEEITNYYTKNYVNDIKKSTSLEEKKEKYKDFLKVFYYDFARCKNKEKKIAMIEAIKLLACADRETIIEIIESTFANDPAALNLFGKELNINHKAIVTNKDELGNTLSKQSATKIAHTAFKHMTEKDVKEALITLRKDAGEFYEKYGEQIKELKARRDKGEKLTEAELELLLEAENVYEGQYSGAISGTAASQNITAESKREIITTTIKDTEELGIQEEVLENVAEFAKNNPEEKSINSEEFKNLLNETTEGKYNEVVESVNSENPSNKSSEINTGNKSVENKSTETDTLSSDVDIKEVITSSDKEPVQGSLGFAITKESELVNISTKLYEQKEVTNPVLPKVTKQTSVPEQPNFVNTIKEYGIDGFNLYLENNGAYKTILEFCNNIGDIANKGVWAHVLKIYDTLDANRQETLLRNIDSPDGFNELLAATSDNVVVNLKTNFNSFYTNQQIENAQNEVHKKRQHGLV